MCQIEKEFLAEESGVDECFVYNSFAIVEPIPEYKPSTHDIAKQIQRYALKHNTLAVMKPLNDKIDELVAKIEYDIFDGMNEVNTLMEREQIIKQLEEKIERQQNQISQLKQEKHKLRQEKAIYKKSSNENNDLQLHYFNRTWKAEHKLQKIDKHLKEEIVERSMMLEQCSKNAIAKKEKKLLEKVSELLR